MTLPKSWETIQLAECQARTTTVDPRKEPLTKFELFSVPSYSDSTPDQVTGADIGSAKQQVEPGDVLLCKIVPHIRRGWVVPPPSGRVQIASGEWIVFRDTPLHPHFLRRFILSDEFHDQFMRTVSGVGGSLMRARPAEAGKINVPVPPLAEQRRIVAKLDALTPRLARARAELDRVPMLARRLRETAVETMLGKTGAVPIGWAQTSIGAIVSEGPSNGWSPKSEPSATGALTLKLTATTSGRLRLDENAVKRILENPTATSRYWLRSGDVLVQRANALEHVGATAIYEGPAQTYIYPDLMMRLRFSEPTLARLVWYRLNSPSTRQYLRDRATGTAGNMPKISGAVLREVPVALPPENERPDAVASLDATFARADRLEAEAARARALIDRLESAILARAFRGELVPQDPNDEPTSVLLDRIRAERAAAPKAKRGRRAKANA